MKQVKLICPHCSTKQKELVTVTRKHNVKVCEQCGQNIGYCQDYRLLSKAEQEQIKCCSLKNAK